MRKKRRAESSAVGDAEIIISPEGEVMIFDLDKRLLKALEAFNPTDARVRTARALMDAVERGEKGQ